MVVVEILEAKVVVPVPAQAEWFSRVKPLVAAEVAEAEYYQELAVQVD